MSEVAVAVPATDAHHGRTQVGAWSLYNWAAHAWFTPIAAVLGGPWLLALAKHAAGGDHAVLVGVGPLRLEADAFPSAMVALAAIVQLLVLAPLGSHIDRRSSKRRWLAGCCAVGAVACGLLALTGGGLWIWAGLLFLVGSLIGGVSDLTWQGMLPELSGSGRADHISAKATAIGYLGGGAILALDLVLVGAHDSLGMSQATAVRLCFIIAGLWWAGFGLPALRRLRPQARATAERVGSRWQELVVGLRTLRRMPHTSRYLIAYFCFADAMSAVISLSSTFLTHQLFHDDSTAAATFLFALILLVQFVAMSGAVLAGRLSRSFGAKPVLVGSLVLWCAAIVYTYAVLATKAEAIVAGVLIGVGLGVTTALARSLFSRMVPPGQEALFFSLYEVTSQGTAWLAPLIFTVVVDATGSFRQAILSLIILFVAGLLILLFTNAKEAEREARDLQPGVSQPNR